MIGLLRAEFRKLLTVRSTYIIVLLGLLLLGFLAFYAGGYKGVGANPNWLSVIINNTSTTIVIFMAIVSILLAGHEYRHNTIMYTLTSSGSRTKVLLAKILTIAIFVTLATVAISVLASLAYVAGVLLSPTAQYVSSQLYWGDVWRGLFFVVGYSLLALLLAFLFRHVVGAIAALFILPTVEELLSILLKDNTKYLPFSSLEQVHIQMQMSAGKAALIFLAYLVVGWLIAWYLFIRRDAN
jgi:ABC-2 type transport system permease protein